MDNEISIFSNPAFGEIHTMSDTNNTSWFMGADVARVLQYTNTAKAIRDHVETEDKLTERIVLSGQNREVIFINESGLYSLILSCKLPQAKQFKNWVTSEVLPSIRRHGAYMTDQSLEKALTDPDYLIRLATVLKDERQRRYEVEAKVKEQNQLITQQRNEIQALDKQVGTLQKSVDDMKEKVSYLDLILASNTSLTITQIAQDYGMSAKALNAKLKAMRIQRKVNDQWILMMEYQNKGYVTSKTIPITKTDGSTFIKLLTVWTPEGRKFLYYALKAEGILPTIERNKTIN